MHLNNICATNYQLVIEIEIKFWQCQCCMSFEFINEIINLFNNTLNIILLLKYFNKKKTSGSYYYNKKLKKKKKKKRAACNLQIYLYNYLILKFKKSKESKK